MIFDDGMLLPYFGCTTCHVVDAIELLCVPSSRGGQLLCVRCCGCDEHASPDDVEGTVIWPQRLPDPPAPWPR